MPFDPLKMEAAEVHREPVSKYAVLFISCGLFLSAFADNFSEAEILLNRDAQHKKIDYKTLQFDVPVDHFSFGNEDRFNMRYLLADQFWDPHNGPVFFYTGNEGDIVWFCNNTGFMWDIAPEFKAMLVFAEHRYYGKSLPYGNDSYKDTAHLGYLSSEQALADYADLIAYLRTSRPGLRNAAFIAFGGSYGGMLSAWIRMKYPFAIQGALAASAPVLFFGDLTPCDLYYEIATKSFARKGSTCPENINRSWDIIKDMGKTGSGRATLAKTFKLCKPLKKEADVVTLRSWLSDTYINLAMVNYPYAAAFLEPLPPWPVNVACGYLERELSGMELITGIASAITVYYNYTGKTKCLNTSQEAVDSLSDVLWNFQACTEMVMPMCPNSKTDMFEAAPWNFTSYSTSCQDQWKVQPRPNSIITQYGGRDISSASNIIFSNGKLDPWSSGGVVTSVSESLVAIMIEDGAHHLDLRWPNPADPHSVVVARKREKELIKQWIAEYEQGDSTGMFATENLIITIHTTSTTHAAAFGVFSLVLIACVALVISIVRRPAKVNVAPCSAALMWMDGEPFPLGLKLQSNESLKTSEKVPLL